MQIYYYSIRFFLLFSFLLHCELTDPKNDKETDKKKELKFELKIGRLSRETPQQVHLSLTDKMDEMTISWMTFEEVETFVEYWQEGAEKKKTLKYSKVEKHEFRDFMKDEAGRISDQKLFDNFRFMHTVTLEGLQDDTVYGR